MVGLKILPKPYESVLAEVTAVNPRALKTIRRATGSRAPPQGKKEAELRRALEQVVWKTNSHFKTQGRFQAPSIEETVRLFQREYGHIPGEITRAITPDGKVMFATGTECAGKAAAWAVMLKNINPKARIGTLLVHSDAAQPPHVALTITLGGARTKTLVLDSARSEILTLEESKARYAGSLTRRGVPEEHALKAVVHVPRDVVLSVIHNNIGYAYFKEGNTEQAVKRLQESLRIYDLPLASLKLGDVHKKKGDMRQAIRFYEKALLQLPHLAPLHRRLANAYGVLGNAAKSREHVQAHTRLVRAAAAAEKEMLRKAGVTT